MKLKPLLFTALLFWSLTTSAQWIAKATFPGAARGRSTAFTIGNKIYVMGGYSSSGITLNDFWEYDIPSNSWLQKPNFPGPERYGAVSFVLNNKGYISTGANDFGYLDDLWEYNPATAAWIQRTGLPAGSAQHENQRTEAYAFVIGNKAYLGGGNGFVFGANSTNNTAFYDLWEYNPINSSWTPMADIPDFLGRNMSIAVSINNKGYVGLGCDVQQITNHQSLWEYDPVANSWTAKANFPSQSSTDASAFVLNSNLYLVGGVNLNNPISLSNQFYKYDPVANAWTSLPAFNGGAVAGEFAVSTGTLAFAGTGFNGSLVPRNDLWELTSVATGIDDPGMQSGNLANIYPNPGSDKISVRSQKEIALIEIYDVAGHRVLQQENTFKDIEVAKLNAGVYNVRMTFRDGSFINKPFIKTN